LKKLFVLLFMGAITEYNEKAAAFVETSPAPDEYTAREPCNGHPTSKLKDSHFEFYIDSQFISIANKAAVFVDWYSEGRCGSLLSTCVDIDKQLGWDQSCECQHFSTTRTCVSMSCTKSRL